MTTRPDETPDIVDVAMELARMEGIRSNPNAPAAPPAAESGRIAILREAVGVITCEGKLCDCEECNDVIMNAIKLYDAGARQAEAAHSTAIRAAVDAVEQRILAVTQRMVMSADTTIRALALEIIAALPSGQPVEEPR